MLGLISFFRSAERETRVTTLWRGGLAAALLVTTAFMMLAIYRSDLEGIALSAIAGWSLWLGFGVWQLTKNMSAKWVCAVALAAALIPLSNGMLLAIAPQAVIFVNFAALHACTILTAVGLGVYAWVAPRNDRAAIMIACVFCGVGAFLMPRLPLPSVVGVAFGVIPAAAVASWLCWPAAVVPEPMPHSTHSTA